MNCRRCGSYFVHSVDTSLPGVCPNCVFQIKMLENQPKSNYGPTGNYTPHDWSMNDLMGLIYLVLTFFIGGGIWVSVEEIFGDTGFLGFVLSMVAGFFVLAGIGGLFTYLNQQSNQ